MILTLLLLVAAAQLATLGALLALHLRCDECREVLAYVQSSALVAAQGVEDISRQLATITTITTATRDALPKRRRRAEASK